MCTIMWWNIELISNSIIYKRKSFTYLSIRYVYKMYRKDSMKSVLYSLKQVIFGATHRLYELYEPNECKNAKWHL